MLVVPSPHFLQQCWHWYCSVMFIRRFFSGCVSVLYVFLLSCASLLVSPWPVYFLIFFLGVVLPFCNRTAAALVWIAWEKKIWIGFEGISTKHLCCFSLPMIRHVLHTASFQSVSKHVMVRHLPLRTFTTCLSTLTFGMCHGRLSDLLMNVDWQLSIGETVFCHLWGYNVGIQGL